MSIRVLLFPSLRQSEAAPQSEMKALLCTTEGGTRKFIVMKQGDEINVVLGPLTSTGGGYYHADLQSIFFRGNSRQFQIFGGGFIDVTRQGDKWRAKFSGSSGDFGPYDPTILLAENRKAIGVALGLPVRFEWEA